MLPALLLGLAVLMGSSGGASARLSAGPTWLPVERVSRERPSGVPEVAMGAGGDSVVVWDRFDGAGRWGVFASYRPAGAPRWPAPVSLGSSRFDANPHAAVDPDGNAVVVWRFRGPDQESRAMASSRGRVGDWTSRPISAPDVGANEVLVDVDPSANFVAAWTRAAIGQRGAVGAVEVSYRPAAGRWQTPVRVSSDDTYYDSLSLDVAPDGSTVLAWAQSGLPENPTRARIGAVVGMRGAWRMPEVLAHPEPPQGAGLLHGPTPAVAAGPNGRALVAWTSFEGGNYVVRASLRPSAVSSWQAPEALSFTDGQAYDPALALDAEGNALAVWATNVDVEASVLPVTGRWQRPVAVSRPVLLWYGPSLSMNEAGKGVAAWLRPDRDPETGVLTQRVVEGATFAFESGWGPVTTLGGGGRSPGTGIAQPRTSNDRDANAAVCWATESSIVAAELDTSGPRLRSLLIPDSGRAGSRLRFSASSVDVWSGPTSTRWSFGDGASVRSDLGGATHVYRKPGRYTIRVIASDTLGHATAVTRTLRVTRRR